MNIFGHVDIDIDDSLKSVLSHVPEDMITFLFQRACYKCLEWFVHYSRF